MIFQASSTHSKATPEINIQSPHILSMMSNEYCKIPDLVKIQRISFHRFLNGGLQDACELITPIHLKSGNDYLTISFLTQAIRFRQPDKDQKNTIKFGKTYGCSVYIPIRLESSQWTGSKTEWMLLGFLPLMTARGHFIVNGVTRVFLHQMVRKPGLHIIRPPHEGQQILGIGSPHVARIIPEQGGWITFSVTIRQTKNEIRTRLWVTTRLLRRKIPGIILLLALGYTHTEIHKTISYIQRVDLYPTQPQMDSRQGRILKEAGLHRWPQTPQEARRYLFAHYQEYTPRLKKQPITNDISNTFFHTMVWDPANRYLGSVGREHFNQQFAKKSADPTHTEKMEKRLFLTNTDILLSIQLLFDYYGQEQAHAVEDMDNLMNKYVRACGEWFKKELIESLRDFQIRLYRKSLTTPPGELENVWKYHRAMLPKTVSKGWKGFLAGGTLSQFMDETNPLSEITHKRRVTVLGPGGVNSNQATIQIRGIHPTYYGRLCPIETPEGKNAGLVNSFTVFTKLDSTGNLQTPYFSVYRGLVQKTSPAEFIQAHQEIEQVIAPADLEQSAFSQLPTTLLPVRTTWNFASTHRNEITMQSVGFLQLISIATSLIPFLEHDDANRALMGSNMQRQAVPLMTPENAIVQTGLELRVVSDVLYGLQAPSSGYITTVHGNYIEVYARQPLHEYNTTSALESNNFFKTWFNQNQYIISPLKKDQRLSRRKTSVKNLWKYHLPYSTKDNVSALHTRPDYNLFEKDSIAAKPTFCSLNTHHFSGYHRTNQSTSFNLRPTLLNGEWVERGDVIADGTASQQGALALGKNVLIAYLPWEGYNFEDAIVLSERLVKDDIFTSLHIDTYEIEVKNTQYGLEKISKKELTDLVDDELAPTENYQLDRLNAQGIINIGHWVKEGDLLVGKITPVAPKAPSVLQQYRKLYNVIMERKEILFRDTSFRVPKGVEGFILDIHLLPPKSADVIAVIKDHPEGLFRVRIVLLQRRKIQIGDKMAGRHGNKGVISQILPVQDMPFLPDGTPIDILLNPLGVPSRMNVGQILECLLGLAGRYLHEAYTVQLFDERFGAEASRSLVYSKLYEASVKTGNLWLFEPHHPGKVRIFDGRTGDSFDQSVTVGIAYMLKLVHLVADKIHARATGPYSTITQQPVRGRARHGGQRVGEMEVWALQAYGAAYLLQELLTVKSDDLDGRKYTVFNLYTKKPLQSGSSDIFKVLVSELRGLCFSLDMYISKKKTGTINRFLGDYPQREFIQW
jgi:DNA-directed RNA polymerase subunit beta